MVLVTVSKDDFIYDVHSLTKAFFPADEVKVCVGEAEDILSQERIRIHIEYCMDSIKVYLSMLVIEESVDADMNNVSKDSSLIYASYEDRTAYKNAIKQCIYELLSKHTGITLPWGTLTGIRPTKIAVSQIQEGKTDEQIEDYYRKVYLASTQKAKLAIDIAHREIDILSEIDFVNGYSLYIGIPFCPTTCLYCSFTSSPRIKYEKLISQYIECLKREIDYVAENFRGRTLDTIYIGGGTPTTLLEDELHDLISYIEAKLDLSHLKEFTVEAGRADSITKDKLQVLRDHEVSRISINPQTFNQKTLDIIGRRHTTEQVIEAYHMARELGFDNINMDLIVGLPTEEYGDVAHTLEVVSELAPDSVTVHSLAIKRASKMGEYIQEHGFECITNSDDIMNMTKQVADAMGLNPYYLYRQKNMSGNMENVGYAKKGKEGIYNILIMEEVQTIVACGAGTITKRVFPDGRIERCDNVKDVTLYIERIDEMIERKYALLRDL